MTGLTIGVDSSTNRLMSTQPKQHTTRKIVGLSLPPAIAKQFKTEAAKRGLSLRDLFQEMWASYEKANTKGGK